MDKEILNKMNYEICEPDGLFISEDNLLIKIHGNGATMGQMEDHHNVSDEGRSEGAFRARAFYRGHHSENAARAASRSHRVWSC